MKQFQKLNIMLKKNYKILFVIFFLFFFTSKSFSMDDIIVKGNKNISVKTILSLAPKNIKTLNSEIINIYQKNLFESGFFENVEIKIYNSKIYINVVENSLVNFFFIEGFKNKEIKEKIYAISKIKENNIFVPFLVKEDTKKISEYLKNLGYLNNEINSNVIKTSDNKINLFYNINLKNKFKIKRIFFIGNKFYKSSTLKDVIYSSEHGWWKFLSNSTTPTEEVVNYDISKLKNFYLDNGFYDVQINSSSIKIINDRDANIIYSINSGDMYIVNKVILDDISKTLKDIDLLKIKKILDDLNKQIYSKFKIRKAFDLVSDYLAKSNFELSLNMNVIKTNNKNVELSFVVDELKNKKIINKIIIAGNNITDDFVIRNNISFSEGDYFNTTKLEMAIDNLKSKNLFKKVKSNYEELKGNKIDITINVEEQPTGEISAGAGAGTDGVMFSGGINENNFLGKGLIVGLNFNIGTEKILGSIKYTNPDFRNSGNSLTNTFFVKNNTLDNASYENKVIGTSSSLTYEFFDKLFLSPGISIDYDSVTANSDASDLIKKREGDFFTSKIFYNISKNTKNRQIHTSEGYTFGIGQDYSVFSDIPFLNNRVFGSYYHEYKNNFIGSVRYKIESINGFDKDIKYSDRLFVGSSNLRGFSSNGIGPKINNDFIGGNYSYYATFSSTFPNGLPEKWNALSNIFFDTANVWGVDDNSTSDSNTLRSAIGIGFSWISPLGPISLTYAEPITKEKTDEVEQFNFKIGSAF